MSYPTLVSIFCLFVFSFGNIVLGQESLRKWQAATGGFSVEAALIEVQTDNVQLRKKDGTLIWVEVKKLSQEDVEFIQKWQNQQAAKSAHSNLKREAARDKNRTVIVPKADDAQMRENDLSDSAIPKSPTRKNRESLDTGFVIQKDLDLLVGPVTTLELAIPATKSPFIGWHHRSKSGTQGYVADLSNGKICKPFNITTAIEGKSLSPDGQLFAFFGGQPTQITVYAPESGEVLHQFQAKEFRGIGAIEFLSPQELMVLGQSQQTGGAIYDVKKGRLLRWLEIPTMNSRYELSSDGKLLALHQQREFIRLVDTKSGKGKAEIKLDGDKDFFAPTVQDLSFCNQDLDLGVLCTGSNCGFRIYDAKSGKLKVKHSLTKSLVQIAHFWEDYKGPAIESLPQEKGWIVYGSAAVDPKLGGPFWVDQPKGLSPMSIYRPLIDENNQLLLSGDYEKQHLKTTPLPWSEIEESRSSYR